MRRIFPLFLSMLGLMPSIAQINVFTPADLENGNPVDTKRYVITYDFNFVKDTLRTPYNVVKERMILEAGDETASFYSYEVFRSDSANAVVMADGGNSFHSGGQITWRIYRNYPEKGSYSWLDKFGLDRFVCVEPLEEPCWQLCPDSSAVILGYPCRMAKASFKGREWSVWYAEDIPLDEGPWLLCGLPGLVLKAYDSQGHFLFEACGMRQCDGTEPVFYKGVKYETVSRRELLDIYRRYYADPAGYIQNNPRVKVVTKDEKGNVTAYAKGVPYNLLDREK